MRFFDPDLTFDLPTDDPPTGTADVTILSYARLTQQLGVLISLKFASTLIDEAHFLKNERSLYGSERKKVLAELAAGKAASLHRTQVAFEVCRSIKYVYCLTGTPILSRPRELFNLLKLTRHPLSKNFKEFSTAYCAGHDTKFSWNADGASNLLELAGKLHNHLLRRVKALVLDLPPKIVTVESFEMGPTFKERYRTAWTDFLTSIKQTRTKQSVKRVMAAKALVKPTLLRQICSESKAESACARIAASKFKVTLCS